jgi:hypothetical protein
MALTISSRGDSVVDDARCNLVGQRRAADALPRDEVPSGPDDSLGWLDGCRSSFGKGWWCESSLCLFRKQGARELDFWKSVVVFPHSCDASDFMRFFSILDLTSFKASHEWGNHLNFKLNCFHFGITMDDFILISSLSINLNIQRSNNFQRIKI